MNDGIELLRALGTAELATRSGTWDVDACQYAAAQHGVDAGYLLDLFREKQHACQVARAEIEHGQVGDA
jgi:hypothetical protein